MNSRFPLRFIGSYAVVLACGALGLFLLPARELTELLLPVVVVLTLAMLLMYLDARQVIRHAQLLERLDVPIALAAESEFYLPYQRITAAVAKTARYSDPILREFAVFSMANVANEIDELAKGRVVFAGTESWRTIYEKLLADLQTKVYYSVAKVASNEYWNDPPGRQSMRFNFELAERGFRIERTLILTDDLWAFEENLPAPEIRPWIDEQQSRGICISLIREHDLISEPDLIRDFGIYGNRATGAHEHDEHSRTIRFTLDFDPHSVKLALQRWERLSLYATPYQTIAPQPL